MCVRGKDVWRIGQVHTDAVTEAKSRLEDKSTRLMLLRGIISRK
jgi:hypothetical protein